MDLKVLEPELGQAREVVVGAERDRRARLGEGRVADVGRVGEGRVREDVGSRRAAGTKRERDVNFEVLLVSRIMRRRAEAGRSLKRPDGGLQTHRILMRATSVSYRLLTPASPRQSRNCSSVWLISAGLATEACVDVSEAVSVTDWPASSGVGRRTVTG